jgi:protein arginine N-methyltransferase 1
MKLQPDTILKRSNSIELNIESVHKIRLAFNHQQELLPNQALAVLEVFAQPESLKEGLKKLSAAGTRGWIELTHIIQKLYMMGALHVPGEVKPLADKQWASFGSAPIHIAMLNDKTRTDMFMWAINSIVSKDDIVLDIGTGTGVLAIAAARAGAKKVYAVEAGGMADVAQKTINRTEVAHKIEVIRGWSTNITLPEKADVLVSEIIGNDPFGEKVLQTFIDARQRLLKPNASIIPNKIKVFVLPVQIPASLLKTQLVQAADLNNWQSWYNIDFSALSELGFDHTDYFMMANYERLQQLELHRQPILLCEVLFTEFTELAFSKKVTVKAEGPFNGLLMYFELNAGDKILSTHPRIADQTNSWRTPVWHFPEVEKLTPGDECIVNFSYNESKGSRLTINVEL